MEHLVLVALVPDDPPVPLVPEVPVVPEVPEVPEHNPLTPTAPPLSIVGRALAHTSVAFPSDTVIVWDTFAQST